MTGEIIMKFVREQMEVRMLDMLRRSSVFLCHLIARRAIEEHPT